MNKPQPTRHVVVVTPEQSLLMDIWEQYAYKYTKTGKGEHDHIFSKTIGLWAGGRSTLESLECYLREHHLISKRGNLYKRVEI